MSNSKQPRVRKAVAPTEIVAEPKASSLHGDGDSPRNQVERLFGTNKDGDTVLKVRTELEMPEHAEIPTDGISAKDAKDATDAILNALGTDKFPQTQFPVPRKNNGPAATAFVVWEHISKVAAKKFKAVTQAAEAEGVFGDPEQYVAGETTMVYNSPEFVISIKKGDDTRMVDRELTEQVLREVAPNRWQELLERCKKPRAGPTQRIVSLK